MFYSRDLKQNKGERGGGGGGGGEGQVVLRVGAQGTYLPAIRFFISNIYFLNSEMLSGSGCPVFFCSSFFPFWKSVWRVEHRSFCPWVTRQLTILDLTSGGRCCQLVCFCSSKVEFYNVSINVNFVCNNSACSPAR